MHRVATEFGYALQYSVFICDLTPVELIRMKGALSDAANLRIDSIAIFDLGKPDGRGIECVQYLGTRPRLPRRSSPEVW